MRGISYHCQIDYNNFDTRDKLLVIKNYPPKMFLLFRISSYFNFTMTLNTHQLKRMG